MVYDLNYSSQTLGSFVGQIGESTGITDMILVFFFIGLVLVGSMLNKKNTGISNIATWLTISGFVVTISATLLYLGGYVSVLTLSMWAIGTIVIFAATEIGGKLLTSDPLG